MSWRKYEIRRTHLSPNRIQRTAGPNYEHKSVWPKGPAFFPGKLLDRQSRGRPFRRLTVRVGEMPGKWLRDVTHQSGFGSFRNFPEMRKYEYVPASRKSNKNEMARTAITL